MTGDDRPKEVVNLQATERRKDPMRCYVGLHRQVYDELCKNQELNIATTGGAISFALLPYGELITRVANMVKAPCEKTIRRAIDDLAAEEVVEVYVTHYYPALINRVRDCRDAGKLPHLNGKGHLPTAVRVKVNPEQLETHLRNRRLLVSDGIPSPVRKRPHGAPGSAHRSQTVRRRGASSGALRPDQPLLRFDGNQAATGRVEASQSDGQNVRQLPDKMAGSCQTSCPSDSPAPLVEDLKQQHQAPASTNVVVAESNESTPPNEPREPPTSGPSAEAFSALRRSGIYYRQAVQYAWRKPPRLVLTVIADLSAQQLPAKVLQGTIINALKDPEAHGYTCDDGGQWHPPRGDPAQTAPLDIAQRVQQERERHKQL